MMFIHRKKTPSVKQGLSGFVLALGFLTVLSFPVKEARAVCCGADSACVIAANSASRALEEVLHNILREHITREFIYQERWFMYDFFMDYVLPGLMGMAEQLSAVGEMQVMAFGTIMDAKEQLETQRLLAQKMAEAHRDYMPDVGMCTIGTAAESMAASDRNAEAAANVLAKRMIDRQMGVKFTMGAAGLASDTKSRIEQFRRRFCDANSNSGNTTNLCLASAKSGGHVNRDIDYAATVGIRRTVKMNLTNTTMDPDVDDEDVMALANNLYGSRVFEKSDTPTAAMNEDKGEISGQMAWYLDKRSIMAKRNVAQNSFNEIVGMKSTGTAASKTAGDYLYAIFMQLGVTDPKQARQMLGSNPSYYALLEAVAQKVYQDPEFFSNLYDAPTNVLRKNVAMQAINLMLDRDTFKSELRAEALLTVLLETEMIQYQRNLALRMNQMNDQAAPAP